MFFIATDYQMEEWSPPSPPPHLNTASMPMRSCSQGSSGRERKCLAYTCRGTGEEGGRGGEGRREEGLLGMLGFARLGGVRPVHFFRNDGAQSAVAEGEVLEPPHAPVNHREGVKHRPLGSEGSEGAP